MGLPGRCSLSPRVSPSRAPSGAATRESSRVYHVTKMFFRPYRLKIVVVVFCLTGALQQIS